MGKTANLSLLSPKTYGLISEVNCPGREPLFQLIAATRTAHTEMSSVYRVLSNTEENLGKGRKRKIVNSLALQV